MRRYTAAGKRRARRRTISALFLMAVLAAALCLNCYINTVVKPTLHKLAEYEARCATVQAVNRAVTAELLRSSSTWESLFVQNGTVIRLNPAAANTAQTQIISAVQAEIDALPEISYVIPFGSLTNNSLLSGIGPGWQLQIHPRGYAEGFIRQEAESLSINTTRYSAVLQVSVTVNMILDSSTSTLTVTSEYPLTTFLVGGDIPHAYAADFD